MAKNTLLDFVEKQEILDNLSTTLQKMYEDDEVFSNKEALNLLTEKTYNVMKYMEKIHTELGEDPGIMIVSEKFDTPVEQVIRDVAEIMLMSTVARQALTIELFESSDE